MLSAEDRAAALALAPHPQQAGFIASNRASLAEADGAADRFPLLIRAGGAAVGFAMYALDADDGNYWIYRFMIDARFQGRGHGTAALALVIGMIPPAGPVMLGVKPGNTAARRLYERAGFRATGALIDDEAVMRLER